MKEFDPDNRAPWVVNVHSGLEGAFEISVLRDDNEHGKSSWGWFDSDKVLVADGKLSRDAKKIAWQGLLQAADKMAARFNRDLAKRFSK